MHGAQVVADALQQRAPGGIDSSTQEGARPPLLYTGSEELSMVTETLWTVDPDPRWASRGEQARRRSYVRGTGPIRRP